MAPLITPAYRIRPLLLGDILDEAVRIYRARFGLMLGSALLASVPGLVIGLGGGSNTLLTAYMQSTFGTTAGSVDGTGTSSGLFVLIGLGVVMAVLLYPVTAAMPAFAASAAALGLPTTPFSILGYAFRNYFQLLVVALVTFFTSVFAFLIFPVYFLVKWSFLYQAYYLERAGVGGSFNRSSTLTFNSWWRIFGIRLLARLIVGVIGFVLGLLVAVPSLLMPAGVIRVSLAGVGTALVAVVLLPFSALVNTLLYLDQRVRLEALDLQLMAGQVGAAPAPPDAGQPGPWPQPAASPPPSP